MSSRLFALVDCNNFYVSCERVFYPSLKNRPVAVLSNNDGCIVSRSDEIKELGIKMGTPYFKAKEIMEKNNGIALSSNYELYGDMSRRVISVLQTFSSNVEIYSIDEAFIEVPANRINGLNGFCGEIVERVYKWTGIPVKVGVARTKTLAKLAAEFVKKEKIKQNYKILIEHDAVRKVLKNADTIDIWGIGKATSQSLEKIGVFSANQLLSLDDRFIRAKYGVMLSRTVLELRGTSCLEIETMPQPQKNLCFSRSFGQPVSDYNSVLESVISYASSAAEKLRSIKLNAQSITVFITTNFFSKSEKKYANSKTIAFPHGCNSTQMIIEYAEKALKQMFLKNYKYKKSGIILNDLIPDEIIQPCLFNPCNIKEDKASLVMDEINRRYGKGSIKLLGQGIKQDWKMRRGKISKRYTSNWEELLDI